MGLQEWVRNSGHLGKIGCERVTPFLEYWSFEATSGGGGGGTERATDCSPAPSNACLPVVILFLGSTGRRRLAALS